MDFLSTLLQRGILLLKLGVCPECTQAQMCMNTTCLLLGSECIYVNVTKPRSFPGLCMARDKAQSKHRQVFVFVAQSERFPWVVQPSPAMFRAGKATFFLSWVQTQRL